MTQQQTQSAFSGAAAGAQAGSMVMPGIGTAIGAVVGLVAGFLSGKKGSAHTTGHEIRGTVSASGFSGSIFGLAQNGGSLYRDDMSGNVPTHSVLSAAYKEHFGANSNVSFPIEFVGSPDSETYFQELRDYVAYAAKQISASASAPGSLGAAYPSPLNQKSGIDEKIAAQLADPLYATPAINHIPWNQFAVGALALVALFFLIKKY